MKDNKKNRLVSIGGGLGYELRDIESVYDYGEIKYINTDPHPIWGLPKIYIINAHDAIKKYKNEETLFLASWPDPNYPYLNEIIDTKVPFIYLGEKESAYKDMFDTNEGMSVGINRLTIENLPEYNFSLYMNEYDKDVMTEERIKEWCTKNGYQVVENMTLEGDKGGKFHNLSSIGWILIPLKNEN